VESARRGAEAAFALLWLGWIEGSDDRGDDIGEELERGREGG
jgi:hypothetical protein